LEGVDNAALVMFAAVLPLLIALVKQSKFSPQANAVIALLIYVVVGILGALLSGVEPTIENAVQFVTVVATVGTVAYKLFWENLGVTSEGAPSIEQRVQDSTSVFKG